ncbi:hypothetical protein THOM_0070 [Trachipleistophora hominis]|uniref:Uncharacterized protein n=1 Tax=Trachipleistophora hominis TaxID=72359 RepID=L7K0D8_TRAHO|nr:hypothetical protein THOM_0070 [Trachipleistophora hominis]
MKDDEEPFTKSCSIPPEKNDEDFQTTIRMLKKELVTKHAASYAAEIVAHYIYIKEYENALLQYEDINVSSDELDRMKLFIEVHLMNVDRRTCTATDGHLVANCIPYGLNSFKCQRAKRKGRPKQKLKFGFRKGPRRQQQRGKTVSNLLRYSKVTVNVMENNTAEVQFTRDVDSNLHMKIDNSGMADEASFVSAYENKSAIDAHDSEVQAQQTNFSMVINLDTSIIDLKRVFWDKSMDMARKTKFIIENKLYVHSLFNKLEPATQLGYLGAVISLTEDKLINFLERKFDLEVFSFLGTYRATTRRFVKDDCLERLKFMLNEEYCKELGYNELWTMYTVFRDDRLLRRAVYKNPFASDRIVSLGFGKEVRNGGSAETLEKVCRVLEINWFKCLYVWVEKYGMVNRLMRETRAHKTKALCAIVNNRTKPSDQIKLEITKKTIW